VLYFLLPLLSVCFQLWFLNLLLLLLLLFFFLFLLLLLLLLLFLLLFFTLLLLLLLIVRRRWDILHNYLLVNRHSTNITQHLLLSLFNLLLLFLRLDTRVSVLEIVTYLWSQQLVTQMVVILSMLLVIWYLLILLLLNLLFLLLLLLILLINRMIFRLCNHIGRLWCLYLGVVMDRLWGLL